MSATKLDHIREISQNARGAWFALLLLLGFVGVVMMAHEDAHFFAVGVATTLPILGVEVPTVAFFVAAPLLITAFYCYLQVYLTGLWDAIAEAPARIDGDRLIDRVHPTLLAQTAVLYRAARRRDGSAPTRAFSDDMLAISIVLVWLTSPAMLALMLWQATIRHDLVLSSVIVSCLAMALYAGGEGLRVARGMLAGRPRAEVHAPWRWTRHLGMLSLCVVLALVTVVLTDGRSILARSLGDVARSGVDRQDSRGHEAGEPGDGGGWLILVEWLGPRQADLREAELSHRPPDWRSWDLWMEDFEQRWRQREGLSLTEPLGNRAVAFREEAVERYANFIDTITAARLSGADLRGARAEGAFLAGADLRGAALDGARLRRAQLQGARLGTASLEGADLTGAAMQHADLTRATLDRADLADAGLQHANFASATMDGAALPGARAADANFKAATLRGANLNILDAPRAVFQRADLREASLQGAKLPGAGMGRVNLVGARLYGARLPGANLSGAALDGADLFSATLDGAYLAEARLHGANIGGASLRGADLVDARLVEANIGHAELVATNLNRAALINVGCERAELLGVILDEATLLCRDDSVSSALFAWSVADEDARLPKGLSLPTCHDTLFAALPIDLQRATRHYPDDPAYHLRLSSTGYVNRLLCDEGETPRTITGTWVPRGDGAWINEANGRVFAQHPDGAWRETGPDDAPPPG
jgi:uncharacterized protein YjbI with pentapeptide repeats